MARVVGLVVAALMVVVGAIWTLQGLGAIGHSAMSDKRFWAVAGPAVAGLGIALGIVVLSGRNRRR